MVARGPLDGEAAGSIGSDNPGHDDRPDPGAPGRDVVTAETLARLLDVPVSVLAFLEARVPQVRSLTEGGGRVYRTDDAVLIAGLTELLYGEGLTLRDVYAMMRSNERARVAERGRERLGGALPSAAPRKAPQRPIPRDARVMPKGTMPAAAAGAAEAAAAGSVGPSREGGQILAELMECVRILEAAR